MTRLDHLVSRVRTKMTLVTFLTAVAWSLSIYGGLVLLALLANKWFYGTLIPHEKNIYFIGLGVSVVIAIGYAFWRRPTAQQAAVEIDRKLSLQEKFSTALYLRPTLKNGADPFVAATIQDAERTADQVSLRDQFPVPFPRHAALTALMAVAVVLTAWLVPARANREMVGGVAMTPAERARANAQETMKRALAEIAAAPPQVQEDAQIQTAKREIEALLRKPIMEPAKAKATAQKALENVESIKDKIKDAQQFAQAQNEMKTFRSMPGPQDNSTPVGKAHQEIKDGKFTEAVQDLTAAVKKFDQMDKKDQEKAAEQMKQLAQQMAAQANNPAVQNQIQQQLQQMGANQQMAQQMAQQMQQAANGDKKAQQQLQQNANKLMQNMNNGQGPNAQQQQQVKNMMQQMQQQANGQQAAANMAQAAQQMAQAMQQAAGQQGGQQQQQGQGQQAQNGGNQQQQAAQQQANAQAGQKAMQQALQQMQAQNQAAQAAAAQQANAQQGQNGQQGQQGQGQQPGQGQNGQGQGQQANGQWGQGQGQGQGQFQPGNPQGKGAGNGGPGVSAGGPRPKGEEAPFGVTQEIAPSQTDEKGKILASSFVKAASERGESSAGLRAVVEREYNEATDEVEQDRIPAQTQKAVREYFDSVKAGSAK